jgi:Flp pilus assembly pilin Flp
MRSTIVNNFKNRALDFLKSESGPTATEYAVMLALVIVALIPTITSFREKVAAVFNHVTSELSRMT